MLLRRIAVALALAAAVLAVAPVAPAVSDFTSGDPAWGHFLSSDRNSAFHRYDEPESTIFNIVSAFTCTLVPISLAAGPGGAIVFGLSCSLVSIA